MRSVKAKWGLYHLLAGGFAILLLYPIIWLLMSSFKESETIFITADTLLLDPFILDN